MLVKSNTIPTRKMDNYDNPFLLDDFWGYFDLTYEQIEQLVKIREENQEFIEILEKSL